MKLHPYDMGIKKSGFSSSSIWCMNQCPTKFFRAFYRLFPAFLPVFPIYLENGSSDPLFLFHKSTQEAKIYKYAKFHGDRIASFRVSPYSTLFYVHIKNEQEY